MGSSDKFLQVKMLQISLKVGLSSNGISPVAFMLASKRVKDSASSSASSVSVETKGCGPVGLKKKCHLGQHSGAIRFV